MDERALPDRYTECERILKDGGSTAADKIGACASLRTLLTEGVSERIPGLMNVVVASVEDVQCDPELRIAAAETICALITEHSRTTEYVHRLVAKGLLETLHRVVSLSREEKLLEPIILIVRALAKDCRTCQKRITPDYFGIIAKSSLEILLILFIDVDTLVDEDQIVTNCLAALSSVRSESVHYLALRLIAYLAHTQWLCGSQRESVCARDGFVQIIAPYLNSDDEEIRCLAVRIHMIISRGPPDHVDSLLGVGTPIPRLLQLMHDGRSKEQALVQMLLLHMLASFETCPRPSQLQEFLGEGVIAPLTRRGCNYKGVFPHLAAPIEQALTTVLRSHPEFWKAVEQVQANLPWRSAPLLTVPVARRRYAPADHIFEDETATEL